MILALWGVALQYYKVHVLMFNVTREKVSYKKLVEEKVNDKNNRSIFKMNVKKRAYKLGQIWNKQKDVDINITISVTLDINGICITSKIKLSAHKIVKLKYMCYL